MTSIWALKSWDGEASCPVAGPVCPKEAIVDIRKKTILRLNRIKTSSTEVYQETFPGTNGEM